MFCQVRILDFAFPKYVPKLFSDCLSRVLSDRCQMSEMSCVEF